MHDDVDSAETLTDGLGDDGAAVRAGDIRGDELICMADLSRPCPGVGEDDRAGFPEGCHDRLADPLRAARDQRALPRELQVVAHSHISRASHMLATWHLPAHAGACR
jgi:hypothetical protein